MSPIAHQRLTTWALTITKGKAAGGRFTITVHFKPSSMTTPSAPNAPMRESFMIASVCSMVLPPPKPSQASANPSSWNAPVMTSEAASINPTATLSGSHCAASHQTATFSNPTTPPTNGKNRKDWPSHCGWKPSTEGVGRRVRNCVATTRSVNCRGAFTGSGSLVADSRTLESRHLCKERQRRTQRRERHGGARTLAQTHAEIQDRGDLESSKQRPVRVLGGAMAKDAVIQHAAIDSRRDCGRHRHGETVDDDEHPARSGRQQRANQHGDFVSAELSKKLQRVSIGNPLRGGRERRALAFESGVIEPRAAPYAVGQ